MNPTHVRQNAANRNSTNLQTTSQERFKWMEMNMGDLRCEKASDGSLQFSVVTGIDDNGWPVWSKPNRSLADTIDLRINHDGVNT